MRWVILLSSCSSCRYDRYMFARRDVIVLMAFQPDVTSPLSSVFPAPFFFFFFDLPADFFDLSDLAMSLQLLLSRNEGRLSDIRPAECNYPQKHGSPLLTVPDSDNVPSSVPLKVPLNYNFALDNESDIWNWTSSFSFYPWFLFPRSLSHRHRRVLKPESPAAPLSQRIIKSQLAAEASWPLLEQEQCWRSREHVSLSFSF